MREKINFRLSRNLLTEMDKFCLENDCNRSEIIRQALQKYLANKTDDKKGDTR